MSIEVKGLTKLYGEQKAVNDISFYISKGEIVGFLGPNGAGKSTTMKIITGYLLPSAGEVKVGGINVQQHPLETKKKIGYLPEANPLYFDMYVREYLYFMADLHKVPNKKKRTEEVIGMTGLTPESKKKIGQLSKGYKQRVGLAAALIHDPEVLILDEPTSGLDPNQIVDIRELIRSLGKNKTVMFSSHILQEVEAICNRVIIINKGMLVADDELAKLQQHGNAAMSVSIQFKEDFDPAVFKALPYIDHLRKLGAGTWEMETSEPEKLKQALLELSLRNKLNIVSLQSEGRSLEDVFRKMTE
jgi:ABC-2 type transport system ATP-binding protein